MSGRMAGLGTADITRLVEQALVQLCSFQRCEWDVLARGDDLTLLLRADGRWLVLRIIGGTAPRAVIDARVRIQRHLATARLAPAPLPFRDGRLVTRVPGPPCSLATFSALVSGSTIERPAPATLRAAGRLAGRLRIAFDRVGAEEPGLVAQLGVLDPLHLTREAMTVLAQLPGSRRRAYLSLTRRVDHRLRAPARPPCPRRLAHGDLHFGNVLRTRLGHVAVDCLDMAHAPPLYDLAVPLATPISPVCPLSRRWVVRGYLEVAAPRAHADELRECLGAVMGRLAWNTTMGIAGSSRPGDEEIDLLRAALEVYEAGGDVVDWTSASPATSAR